ncbi:MAG: hypothetical protein ACYDIA_19040, partial [Candidatus Humimicrobiaceae bacterium]
IIINILNMATLILKRPVKYGKITLTSLHIRGDYHMFTGLKNQLELQGSLLSHHRTSRSAYGGSIELMH